MYSASDLKMIPRIVKTFEYQCLISRGLSTLSIHKTIRQSLFAGGKVFHTFFYKYNYCKCVSGCNCNYKLFAARATTKQEKVPFIEKVIVITITLHT